MRQVAELETVLQSLINEHEKLLEQLDAQSAAMKVLNSTAMDDARQAQESIRLRIASLETRRRLIVQQVAVALKLDANTTMVKLAEALPAYRTKLLDLRSKLRELMQQVSSRAQLSGRIAGAVLGHLNTVVRLIAGAVEQAGVYTKTGSPKVSGRIGVLEAVG
jgi:hypothetical protein